jgi:hypothetical protein
MIRPMVFLAGLASAVVLAQSGGPIVPPASTYNNYGGYYGYGGGTPAGNAMQGMASVISAQGNRNLSNSAAAINWTQAQSNYIKNRQQATDAYFQMRAANRAYSAAERGPPPSKEQLARLAAEGAPAPIGTDQVNPVSGQIAWPDLLTDDRYAAERMEVEQLAALQAQAGRLGITDQQKAGAAIESMSTKLSGQIRDVPSQQFVAARNFLKSLKFSMTHTQLQ